MAAKDESPYVLVDVSELKEDIKHAKKVKIISRSSSVKSILTKSGYQVTEEGIIKNPDGSTILGVDGDAPNINKFGALMPGSNIFVPRNRSAFYKYFAEHKKA